MPIRIAILLASLVLILPVKGTADITVVSGHPRIFITPTNLPTLQARAATTHLTTYRDLKTWCDTYWTTAYTRRTIFTTGDRDYDAGVLRYALIYRLGTIAGESYAHTINEYGDKTVETLLNIVGNNDSANLEYAAMAYDWVYDRISSGDKTTIVAWFVTRAGTTPALRDRVGYRFAATPYSFYPGLAFYGDGINDSQAQIYINFIPTWLDDARCTSHESGHAGGHAAGLGYGKYTYGTYYHQGMDLYALLTATNQTIADTFEKYPYMKGFGTWLLYGTQPGGDSGGGASAVATVTKWEDCGSWLWNIPKTDHALMQALRILVQVAIESGDTERAQWLTWLINTRYEAPTQETTWDMLFNDRTTTAVSPTDWGTSPVKAFGWNENLGEIDTYEGNPKAGLGHIYMKSSWDTAATATHACFKPFPYYYFGHQHFDALAFSIFKGEPLALPNSGAYYYYYEGAKIDYSALQGYPHHWYYYERTVANNSLLIVDPDEVIRMREEYYQSDQSYKDSGQRDLSDPGGQWGAVEEGPPTADEIKKAGGGRDWGRLLRYDDTAEYTYSAGDATKGYNSIVDGDLYVCRGPTDGTSADPKVSLVQRDFVYLKSPTGSDDDYFVVFDRVEATDPTFKKVFLLHTVGEPVLNGSENTIFGDSGGGIVYSTDTNSYHTTQTTAQLFMQTLLPAAPKVYKMGGSVDSTTTVGITAEQGATVGGAKTTVTVADSSIFSDHPVVTIDNGSYIEAFMCDGNDTENDQLTGCIRGLRYYKYNAAQVHAIGSTVKQDFAWMVREADTDNWISYPHDYGTPHNDSNKFAESDDYGKWALWVETTVEEDLSNFLHVLHPSTDMDEASMATTTLVTGDTDITGCYVNDADNRWVVMFTKDSGLVTEAEYSISVTSPCKHLVAGLEEGIYDIYVDSVNTYTKRCSGQNVLYFESGAGTLFQLVKTNTASYMVDDFTFYDTPAVAKPAKGVPFEDPVHHTIITRITDSETELHGSEFDYAQPGYPRWQIENADGSMLIVQSYSGTTWHVWDANPPFEKIKDIPTDILNSSDPDVRWDNVMPNILYAHKGAKFYQWNVLTEEVTELHDFAADFPGETITSISMAEEGDASDDRRYWAFQTMSSGIAHQTHVLVYDKINDEIVSDLDWEEGVYILGQTYFDHGVWARSTSTGLPMNYNSVGMSPSGDYVVTGTPPAWIYPRDFSTSRIISTHGHIDCAVDDEGRDVIFWLNHYYGPTGYVDHGYWTVMAGLSDGVLTYLGPFGTGTLYHPSGNAHDRPGWALVSSYAPDECAVPTAWSDSSVIVYELTRRITAPTWGNHAKTWRVAHTHMCRERYSDDPFAKFNKRGTKIFFGSGWGSSVNDAPYDVYQIDLPQDWYTTLGGEVEAEAPATVSGAILKGGVIQ